MAGPVCEVALGKDASFHVHKVREEQVSASILSLDLAATSDLAAASLSDGRVHVWRVDSGEAVHDFTFPVVDSELRDNSLAEPIRVRFSPDGKTLAISHLSRVYLYDVASWRAVISLGVPGEDAARPRPSPRLAIRPTHEEHKTAGEMGRAYMETMAKGDGATRITDFAFTPDGSAILAAYCRGACFDDPGSYAFYHPSGKDPVRLWELPSGRMLWERVYGADVVVGRVVPSPDGRLFAAANKQPGWCTVQVHDLKTGERLYSLHSVEFFPGLDPSIRFTPDGGHLITFLTGPTTKKFRPWEHLGMYVVRDGSRAAEFNGKIGAHDADISPDGQWLAAPTENRLTFKVYDMKTQKRVVLITEFPWGWTGPPLDRVRFAPSGKYLVVASRGLGRLAVYRIEP